jgi:hypothetical protein
MNNFTCFRYREEVGDHIKKKSMVRILADLSHNPKCYCHTCANFKQDPVSNFCTVKKKVIARPDEPYCSWWKSFEIINKGKKGRPFVYSSEEAKEKHKEYNRQYYQKRKKLR